MTATPPSSTDRVADVVVVGGGPSGASAAVELARRGHQVVVLDKSRFPRDKICGDGLTVWALRQLEHLGLDRADVASWRVINTAVVSSPSRHEIVLPLPDDGTFAAVARRVDLDAAVLDLARRAGAEVRDGTECVGAIQDADGVTVTTGDGSAVRARWAIGADGMWSPLRRFLGAATPGYRGDWHAFRQYVDGVDGPVTERLYAWFEPDFLPGYAWAFPVGDGQANIGFGILRGGRWPVGAMGQLWREILDRPHVRAALGPGATPEGPHRAWPIPARADGVTLTRGRALFVGDAAAAADPLTGEGIGQALATGRWAAVAIGDHQPDPAGVRAAYERQVTEHLHADHAMSNLLGRALSHRKGARTAIRVAGLTPWTRRNFGRWLFEDYPRAIIWTPRRWHPGVFTGPGAYRSPDHRDTAGTVRP